MQSTTFLVVLMIFSCHTNNRHTEQKQAVQYIHKAIPERVLGQRVIHVFVALCDNTYQGIVPVPPKIGNGQDAANNLYWGCRYGIKTFFSNSKEWELQKVISSGTVHPVLERCVFKNRFANTWLVADAFDGRFIKTCTETFLAACAGNISDSVELQSRKKIYVAGTANLLAYIGHNGLMDFKLQTGNAATDTLKRETIILACISRPYFMPLLKPTGTIPILWSTGLMAPEAYILHDALSAWVKDMPALTIKLRAAAAYSKYQKCSLKAANNLLVYGW